MTAPAGDDLLLATRRIETALGGTVPALAGDSLLLALERIADLISGGSAGAPLTVEEEDGNPVFTAVTELIFPNGSLANSVPGGHIVEVVTILPAHLLSQGSTPGIAAGAGAGPSPQLVALTGSDTTGVIQITTDASTPGSASAIVATITFAAQYAHPPIVLLIPANEATSAFAGQPYVKRADTTTALWKFYTTSAGLAKNTAFAWQYFVIDPGA